MSEAPELDGQRLIEAGVDAEVIERLSEDDLAELSALFAEARRGHRARLRQATDDSLQILPGILRKQVLKLLNRK